MKKHPPRPPPQKLFGNFSWLARTETKTAKLKSHRSTGEELSLADIHIETGRFHQIRAQMANAGMALLGDVKYGDEETKECSAKLGVRTVALCAYKLSFIHPVSGETLSFETKPETKGFSFFPLS